MSEVKLADWARNRAREILKRRAIEARESALYQLTHGTDYDTSKVHPLFQEAARAARYKAQAEIAADLGGMARSLIDAKLQNADGIVRTLNRMGRVASAERYFEVRVSGSGWGRPSEIRSECKRTGLSRSAAWVGMGSGYNGAWVIPAALEPIADAAMDNVKALAKHYRDSVLVIAPKGKDSEFSVATGYGDAITDGEYVYAIRIDGELTSFLCEVVKLPGDGRDVAIPATSEAEVKGKLLEWIADPRLSNVTVRSAFLGRHVQTLANGVPFKVLDKEEVEGEGRAALLQFGNAEGASLKVIIANDGSTPTDHWLVQPAHIETVSAWKTASGSRITLRTYELPPAARNLGVKYLSRS